jgi:hypothetical protein
MKLKFLSVLFLVIALTSCKSITNEIAKVLEQDSPTQVTDDDSNGNTELVNDIGEEDFDETGIEFTNPPSPDEDPKPKANAERPDEQEIPTSSIPSDEQENSYGSLPRNERDSLNQLPSNSGENPNPQSLPPRDQEDLNPALPSEPEEDQFDGIEFTNPELPSKSQKGPFYMDSQIIIQELTEELEPNGNLFINRTEDNLGSFDLPNNLGSHYIETSVTGYYFDETTGEASDGMISLSSYSSLTDGKNRILIFLLL